MRPIFLTACLAVAALVAGCGEYANSVEGDVEVPQSNGPNPQNLPDPNGVPKPNSPSGYPVAISPVTIEEVATSQQWVELYNASAFEADIGGWSLTDGQYGHTFPFGFRLQAGARVIIHLGVAGTDTTTEQYAPSFAGVNAANGALALVRGGGELMHFVQWGADNQPYEGAAVQIGLWTAGDFVATPAQGDTMNYDGTANDSSAWHALAPTPGN